jgi:hypothetical protein
MGVPGAGGGRRLPFLDALASASEKMSVAHTHLPPHVKNINYTLLQRLMIVSRKWKRLNLRSIRAMSTHHMQCEHSSLLLTDFLQQRMNINRQSSLDLVRLGSVYHCSAESKEPPRRVMNDRTIYLGDYVRLYLDTTRYDTKSIDWGKTILFDCPEFVVINKPAGPPPALPSRQSLTACSQGSAPSLPSGTIERMPRNVFERYWALTGSSSRTVSISTHQAF